MDDNKPIEYLCLKCKGIYATNTFVDKCEICGSKKLHFFNEEGFTVVKEKEITHD